MSVTFKMTLRMPHALHAKANAAAEASGRSLNQEILDRLAQSFGVSNLPVTEFDLAARIETLEKAQVELAKRLEILEETKRLR